MEVEGSHHERFEEEDTLKGSRRRNKNDYGVMEPQLRRGSSSGGPLDGGGKASYKDTAWGTKGRAMQMEMQAWDDGVISDNDLVEEDDDET